MADDLTQMYCNFPYAYTYLQQSAAQPTDTACQRLVGFNRYGTYFSASEIEVWVMTP